MTSCSGPPRLRYGGVSSTIVLVWCKARTATRGVNRTLSISSGENYQKLKATVVGAGLYGEVHIRAWHREPRVELVRVWSRSEQRARSTGKKYDVPYTTDLQEIADDEQIDLVSIATPDFAHTGPAIMMLEAGKHVLLEKPMATTTADCQQILKAAQRGGGQLMVNLGCLIYWIII